MQNYATNPNYATSWPVKHRIFASMIAYHVAETPILVIRLCDEKISWTCPL